MNFLKSRRTNLLSVLVDASFFIFSVSSILSSLEIVTLTLLLVILSYISGKYHDFRLPFPSFPRKFFAYLASSLCVFFPVIFFSSSVSILLIILYWSSSLTAFLIIFFIQYLSVGQSRTWYAVLTDIDFEVLSFYVSNHSTPFTITRVSLDDLAQIPSDSCRVILSSSIMLSAYDLSLIPFVHSHSIIYSPALWLQRYCNVSPVELLSSSPAPLFFNSKNRIYLRIKRVSDILLSISLIFLLSPVLLFMSLVLFVLQGSPIFYVQERHGLYGRPFMIYKFRTMVTNAECSGPQWSTSNDFRVTPVGKFLRKSRIDELPQLINVLLGDMSIVGPRPERPFFDKKLAAMFPGYFSRYNVLPGLTGWCQVNCAYGASFDDSKYRISHDLFYLEHISFLIDLFIILKTLRVVSTFSLSEPLS